METFEQALTLISPKVYMASLDLESSSYCGPIAKEDQKYLSLNLMVHGFPLLSHLMDYLVGHIYLLKL